MSQIDILDEIIVDNFAGGGGASTGIELAAGRPVAIAINHDPAAILLHKTNHPYTEHLQASVWDVDPVEVCRGRPVGLAWFSPDCKHFSKAKGAALVDKKIRGLAWIVLRWAAKVRPRVIMLENVEEFQTWGPVRKGKPVKKKAGQTFRKWKQQLSDLGYEIEHRELVAADYGAPTTRKRFVLVARCDGQPILWPEPTHGPRDSKAVKSGKLKPWRSAAEVIDWSVPGYSIFATRQEIREKYGVRAQRPLKPNTLRRIIRGVDKFTIKSGKPFIVECNHSGDGHIWGADEPVNTVTGKYTGGVCQPMIAPFIAQQKFSNPAQDVSNPLTTVTTVGAHSLMKPVMVPYTFSNTGGSVGSDAGSPVHTIRTAGGQILSAGNLIQYHTEQSEKVRGQCMYDPIMTVDAANRYGLARANLVEYYGNGNPLDLAEPMHTVTTKDREALVCAHIDKYFGGGYSGCGNGLDEPLTTVTVEPRHSCVAAHVVKFKGQELGTDPGEPLPTVTSQSGAGGFAECRAVLIKANSRENLGNWPQIRGLLNEYCGYNLAEIEMENVLRKALGLIAEHAGVLPGVGQAFTIRKDDVQDEIHATAMAPIEDLWRAAFDEDTLKHRAKRTDLHWKRLRVWQRADNLDVVLVNPEYMGITSAPKNEALVVGNALYVEGTVSRAYIFQVLPRKDEAVMIEHLGKMQWVSMN